MVEGTFPALGMLSPDEAGVEDGIVYLLPILLNEAEKIYGARCSWPVSI